MNIQGTPLDTSKNPYGGFWKRGIALTIDFLILDLLGFLYLLLFSLGMHIFFRIILKVDNIPDIMPLIKIIGIVVFVIPSFILMNLYFIFMHGRHGSTIGKMLVGLKVVRTDHTPINYKIAFIRWLGFLLTIPTFNIGFLLAAFDSKKQALHDKIARTYVVKTK